MSQLFDQCHSMEHQLSKTEKLRNALVRTTLYAAMRRGCNQLYLPLVDDFKHYNIQRQRDYNLITKYLYEKRKTEI